MRQAFLGRRVTRVLPLTGVILALLSQSAPFAADTYVQATVNEAGQLRIVTAAGQTIEPTKEPDQVGFAKPLISPDGGAVGWLAQYPNCCTSYPIPLKLMILTNGRVRAYTGTGLPVWHWKFQAGGRQFSFRQETVHGGSGVHYELRDVSTGRLLAEYDPPVGRDNQPLPRQNVPKWVAGLDASG
jgi:hypothetical protein